MIGLPGDKIKINDGNIVINDTLILRKKLNDFIDTDIKSSKKRVRKYKEYFF